VYEVADRSAQHWLAALLTPIESQIREHQGQLRQRLDSIQRVLDAGGALQVRIDQLEDERNRLDAQATELGRLGAELAAALTAPAPQDRQPLSA
jgi:chromosome segregation ATPase